MKDNAWSQTDVRNNDDAPATANCTFCGETFYPEMSDHSDMCPECGMDWDDWTANSYDADAANGLLTGHTNAY